MLVSITQMQGDSRFAGIDSARQQMLLNASIEYVENLCSRKLDSQTFTETYVGNGARYLLLDQYPVTAINSVKYRILGDTELTLLDATEYEVTKAGKLARITTVWSTGCDFVIEYVAGYVNAPASIVEAVLQVADWLKGNSGTEQVLKERIGDYSVEYADKTSAPKSVTMLLAAYKRKTFIKATTSIALRGR